MSAPEGGKGVSPQHRHEAVVDRRAVEGATPAATRTAGSTGPARSASTSGAGRTACAATSCRATGPARAASTSGAGCSACASGAAGACRATGTRGASGAAAARSPSGPARSPVGETDEAGPVRIAGPVAHAAVGEGAGLPVVRVVVAVVLPRPARARRAAGVAGAAIAGRATATRRAAAAPGAVDVHADEAVAGCVAGPDAWLAVGEGAGLSVVGIVEAVVTASTRSRGSTAAGRSACVARPAASPGAGLVARAPGVTVGAGLRCRHVAAPDQAREGRQGDEQCHQGLPQGRPASFSYFHENVLRAREGLLAAPRAGLFLVIDSRKPAAIESLARLAPPCSMEAASRAQVCRSRKSDSPRHRPPVLA